MHIMHLKDLAVNFAGREIFKGISWSIHDRGRVGFVGPNGAGKSTLLKAIAGEVPLESGHIHYIGDVEVGYLPQEISLPALPTLFEAACVPPPRLQQVEAEIDHLQTQLGEPDVYEDEERLTQTLEQLDTATALYDRLGGNKHINRVETILMRLGFSAADYDLPTVSLSGGQKKLVALARLALGQPNVLLLDEPDNHLDMASKGYLEAFIREYNGAVVIVSHDRYLLDEVAQSIVELEAGNIKEYPGNYTYYAEQRELDLLRQQQLYLTQQKQVQKLKEQIRWFEDLARRTESEKHARKARHRRRMLERWEDSGELVDRVVEARTMDLNLSGWRGSTKAIAVESVSMAFEDDPLFFDLDFIIEHGERVGLIGPNGAGKSVLFRLILGQIEPMDGMITVGPSTRIGYYAQEHQTLNKWLKRTPIDLIRDIKPMPENAAVSTLLKFAYQYEQTRQSIGTLSGGERSRLQFLTLMLQEPNLLLLDEPTNNLDIPSVEVLESALSEFNGAVLAISHDRYFLDRVVDRVLELDDGILTQYIGGYAGYLEDQRIS